jgi:hypothetical protein
MVSPAMKIVKRVTEEVHQLILLKYLNFLSWVIITLIKVIFDKIIPIPIIMKAMNKTNNVA